MTDFNTLYKSNSDYLKAEDLGTNMYTLTVKGVEPKTFDDGTTKLVLSFAQTNKIMPLNVTNARSIADIYGVNYEAWINQQLVLFTMKVQFQDKLVDAIRIRPPQVQQQPFPEQPAFGSTGTPQVQAIPQQAFTQPSGQPGPQVTTPQAIAPPVYTEANPPPLGEIIDDSIPF